MTGTTFPSGISTRKKYGGTTTAAAYHATTKLVRRTAVIRSDTQPSGETQTGFTFPTNAICHNCFLNVITVDAGITVDVGTMGTTNDPDGFLDAASLATAGPVTGILTAASRTLGALLTDDIGTGNEAHVHVSVGGDPVSYTINGSPDTAVFDIIIDYSEVVTEI